MDKTELETKADAIDAVLLQHEISGRISGGVVAPRSVQFILDTSGANLSKVKTLAGDLALAIGAPEVQVTR